MLHPMPISAVFVFKAWKVVFTPRMLNWVQERRRHINPSIAGNKQEDSSIIWICCLKVGSKVPCIVGKTNFFLLLRDQVGRRQSSKNTLMSLKTFATSGSASVAFRSRMYSELLVKYGWCFSWLKGSLISVDGVSFRLWLSQSVWFISGT